MRGQYIGVMISYVDARYTISNDNIWSLPIVLWSGMLRGCSGICDVQILDVDVICSAGHYRWGYVDQSWMYLAWRVRRLGYAISGDLVSLLVLAPTLMNITVCWLRIGVRNVRGLSLVSGSGLGCILSVVWRLWSGVYYVRDMKAPVWVSCFRGLQFMNGILRVLHYGYVCDIYKLVSVDYDLWMDYCVSFTEDVYVISISLYSWIIICLYSDSVLHGEYECDIYILVVRSLGLGRGF